MSRAKFDVFTEPHVAEVGDKEFRFYPEVLARKILEPYRELMASLDGIDLDPKTLGTDPSAAAQTMEQGTKTTAALCRLLSALMLPEDREVFEAMDLPDRVIGQMFQWIMEVYGGSRPTGPSNGSSPSVSSDGVRSTERLQPEGLMTPAGGA